MKKLLKALFFFAETLSIFKLGVNSEILDDQFFSSTTYDSAEPKKARLNDVGWCAADDDTDPYLMIDLKDFYKITIIVTKGSMTYSSWVRSYWMASLKGEWTAVKIGDGTRVSKNI